MILFLSQGDCRFKYVMYCTFVFVPSPVPDLEELNGAQTRGMLPVSSLVSVANGERSKGVFFVQPELSNKRLLSETEARSNKKVT